MLTVTCGLSDSKISYVDGEKRRIGERIKQARLAFKPHRLTQQQLAEAVKVSRPAVTQWETGETKSLEGENLHKVAETLGVTVEWLLYGKESTSKPSLPAIREPSNVSPGPAIRGMVPLISWVSAGRWREPDVSIDGPLDWVPFSSTNPNTFALRVEGDSMEPNYPPDTVIVVDPEREPQPMNLVVALNGDGEATFKRLTRENGVWWLTPINRRYPLQPLDSLCKIIGVVIWSGRREV